MGSEVVSLAYPAVYGVNTAETPVLLNERNAGRYIQQTGNLRIHNNWYRTNFQAKELKCDFGEDVALWQSLHTQQAIWYLPQAGQGAHYLGVGSNRIVESAGGRLFTLTPKGDTFSVRDVSGGNVATDRFLMCWICQGENYVIRTDGKSQTQIWNGKDDVVYSLGYNSSANDASEFPNQAGATVYAGGRFWTVLFGRRIYAGDSLHQTNETNATDIIKFTDQSYDYLNVYFAPPASEGDIVGLCVSINSGNRDSRAQGEVMAMCNGPAIWSVQLGIPREQWPSTQMRQPRSTETAATGPDAFYVRDGDIILRTSLGIESINLLARERSTLGNPVIDLGADLREIFRCDDEKLLLFASMANPPKWSRMYCTVSPQLRQKRHYHLGWVSANWNPLNQRIPQGFAWEGVQNLPAKMGRVVKFLPMQADGQTRMFALLDKNDGESKGLAELTLDEGSNIFADGTQAPVEWYLLTKKLAVGGVYGSTQLTGLWLRLDEVKQRIQAEVFVRTDRDRAFRCFRAVDFRPESRPGSTFPCEIDSEKTISLGKPDIQGVTWFQILVKGSGVTSIDLGCRYGNPGTPDEHPDPECTTGTSDPICNFDPFMLTM